MLIPAWRNPGKIPSLQLTSILSKFLFLLGEIHLFPINIETDLTLPMNGPSLEEVQENESSLCLVDQLCPTLCDLMDGSPPGSSCLWDFPGKNTGVGCHALLQGIFPTQGSNPGLQHCGQTLYHLSHQGSPRILEWVAYPSSRGSSWPRNWTRVSCIPGGCFTSWATYTSTVNVSLPRKAWMLKIKMGGLVFK